MVTLDTKPDPRLASTRKRFARRQWARRWLAWRRLLVAALVLLLVGGAVYTVYFSSVLAVEGVEVRGLDTLRVADITAAADVPVGEPLATIDLEAIERKVSSLGEVRSVEVSRQWPHDVLIEVEERVPVAVLRLGDQLRNLDADGVIFGDRKHPPGNLPMVETDADTSSDALREAAAVAGALDPALLAIVDHLEVATVDQITLFLRDGRIVRWGSSEQSQEKAEVLSALLKRKAEVYDVSVPGAPTTGPNR
jgi:cell division protein FtsQ